MERGSAAVLGLPGAAVRIACSHTHAGPAVALPPPWARGEAGSDTTAEDAALEDDCPVGAHHRHSACLMDQLAGCAFLAAQDVRPGSAAGAAWGEGTAIGIHRRQRRAGGRIVLGENPGGPSDHRNSILGLEDGGGRPLAAVLHHACDPVMLGPDSHALSADYVGYARAALEAAIGVPVLFLQGACGNINPTQCGTFEVADRHGHRPGGEAPRL